MKQLRTRQTDFVIRIFVLLTNIDLICLHMIPSQCFSVVVGCLILTAGLCLCFLVLLKPVRTLYLFSLFSHRKKNRTNDAIRMFKRCTEIDATYVQAHLELFRLNRESQAALILSDAIKANPDNVELRLAFGHWLLNNGNNGTDRAKHKHSHKHTHVHEITLHSAITWLHFSRLVEQKLNSQCSCFHNTHTHTHSLCSSISFNIYIFRLFCRTSTCRYADISMDTRKGCVKQACNYWYLQVNAQIGSMVAIAFANVEVGPPAIKCDMNKCAQCVFI